jgi:hypothetical protein
MRPGSNFDKLSTGIGAEEVWVAVPPDRDEESVQVFPTFTADLMRLAEWLAACGIETVAMEATGVYWIPLFEILEAHGFVVYLVNARHLKNVSGRKSDVWTASGSNNCTPMVCSTLPFVHRKRSSPCAAWYAIGRCWCSIARPTFSTCRRRLPK